MGANVFLGLRYCGVGRAPIRSKVADVDEPYVGGRDFAR